MEKENLVGRDEEIKLIRSRREGGKENFRGVAHKKA